MYSCDPVGKTDFDLYPHREAGGYYEEEQKVMRTGNALVGREWRTLDETGALQSCWSVNKFPLRDAGGNISGLVGIDFDITESKLSEQALRESEERYRALVETLPHGIAEADLRGTLTFANPAILKMLGCSAEQFIGKPAWAFDADPQQPHTGRSYFEHVMANKPEPTPFVGRFRRLDGNIVDLQMDWYFKRDIDAAITGATAVITDITERKMFAEKLRESEEQYRGVVENSLDGIIVSRGDTILFANSRVAEMFGYPSLEDLYTRAPWDLIIAEQRQLLRERGRNRMDGRDVPHHFEFTGLRKDGTTLDVEIRAALISHKGQKAVQVMMRDVTERNRLRRELAEYREKILQAEKNAYVNSIGAAVAHQLNQPLTVLNLLLEETLSELAEIPCPQAVKAHVADCLAESKNAGDIIARFRTYSKDPHFEVSTTVNVQQVLARITAALSDNAARMKVKVTVSQTADVPPVEASIAALEQVGFLLTQNAIQAADGKSDHKLEISIRPVRNAVRIEFADDCGGIPAENLEKIFEPFFTTKPAGQGTGLGLAIVQRILLAHGGKVTVRSRPGRGSTFSVIWPLKKDA
jgi:PAS domain S-box-containing protein